jgi:hypothetical protein
MKKHVMAVVIFALLFCGCGLLEKTHTVTILNDTLNEVTVYFDDEKPVVLHKADCSWKGVAPLVGRYYFNDVEEGDYELAVKCEGNTYRQTLTVDRDLELRVSELSDAPSVYHPLF